MRGNSRQVSHRPKLRKLSKREQADIDRRNNELVIPNLEWAYSIARQVLRGLPTWFTIEDLLGPAEIGLIQAAERYKPTRNDNFRAYAQQRVWGACISAIRRREYRERAHYSVSVLATDHSSNPKERPEGTWQNWSKSLGPAAHGKTPDELVAAAKSNIFAEVWHLPGLHQRVVYLHYHLGISLEEVASRIGVGSRQASRIHREALEMLRPAAERMK